MLVLCACEDPFAPDAVNAYVDVTTGVAHACALSTEGVAYCWGLNDHGQLGVGDKDLRVVPERVTGGLTFAALTAGASHTCGLTTDGRAYCWGWNAFYQRGNPTDGRETEPVPVSTEVRFTDIDAGWHHTCAIAEEDGAVYCWGHGRYGQNGLGGTLTLVAPFRVEGVQAVAITAGSYHTCALEADGAALCWGANEHGQLGIGSDALQVLRPSRVAGPAFAQISAGETHTCAVTTTRRPYCWGSNIHGELGDQSSFVEGFPGSYTPAPVILDVRAREISAGANFTCMVLTTNSRAQCWGRGAEGQLGNGGDVRDHFVPQPLYVQPAHLHQGDRFEYATIAASTGTFACAVVDESVFCWGTGVHGELGVSENRYAGLPLRVDLP
jgi:alpha-tubulin suppressor-like RCC1 family protein